MAHLTISYLVTMKNKEEAGNGSLGIGCVNCCCLHFDILHSIPICDVNAYTATCTWTNEHYFYFSTRYI